MAAKDSLSQTGYKTRFEPKWLQKIASAKMITKTAWTKMITNPGLNQNGNKRQLGPMQNDYKRQLEPKQKQTKARSKMATQELEPN